MERLVLCGLDEILRDDIPMWRWQHEERSRLAWNAYKGDMDGLTHLVTRENVDERGLRGYSPLMWSCAGNKLEAVMFLLSFGANVNHTDDVGVTPLHVAAWYGRKLIVKALIESGADVNISSHPRDGCRNNHTPLHFACLGLVQAVTVMKLLIVAGADLNAENGRGETPLHLAVLKKDPKKAAILLKAGAGVETMDQYNDTPVDLIHSMDLPQKLYDKFAVLFRDL